MSALERAGRIKTAYAEKIMSKANVVGVGVGFTQRGGRVTQEIGLIVLVTRKLPRDPTTAHRMPWIHWTRTGPCASRAA